MKILVTGFKPFLGETINPSEELANKLSLISSVEAFILPVSFEKSFQILKNKIAMVKPDFIIMIGQAAGRTNVCLEKVALNWIQTENADESGFVPETGRIVPGGDLALMTGFPIDQVFLGLKKAGFPVEISFSAGTYVCNDLYFRVLNEYKEMYAIFVHVPLLPEQLKQEDARPFMNFERQLEVLTAIVSSLKNS